MKMTYNADIYMYLITKYFRFDVLGHKLFFKQLHIDKLFTKVLDNTRIVDVAKISDEITFKGMLL